MFNPAYFVIFFLHNKHFNRKSTTAKNLNRWCYIKCISDQQMFESIESPYGKQIEYRNLLEAKCLALLNSNIVSFTPTITDVITITELDN